MVVTGRLVAVLLCCILGAESARVLMLLPFAGKSMKNVFYGMGSALAERGHEVVFYNPYKPSSPVPNIKEIVPDKLSKLFVDNNLPNLFKLKDEGMHAGFKQMYNLISEAPRIALESEELDALLKERFDMVILGPFANAFYCVPYLLKVPFAVLTPLAYLPFLTQALGNPTLPAISPLPLTVGTDHMSFTQRVKNVIGHLFMMYGVVGIQRWHADRLVSQKFGEGVVPPSAEIERNMSVLFQSSNPVIDYHHPILPNVIEVGGLHCAAPKPLPKQLTDFIGNSEFIYFSLGSVAQPKDMPTHLRAAVLKGLGSLPFKVLLKWDTTDRKGIPANILPSKWLPQQDILGSSKCRLFVSHGGFASVLESICHGVPMVTIPLSGDHDFNAANAERLGVAVRISWEELTPETLVGAVHAALGPALLEAARLRGQLMLQQPVSPRQLAVHWVEHAIRHGGAPHLRSIGADLYWFQYYSLDVLVFLLAVVLLLLKLMAMVLTCCCRRLCGRKQATPHGAKRTKRD